MSLDSTVGSVEPAAMDAGQTPAPSSAEAPSQTTSDELASEADIDAAMSAKFRELDDGDEDDPKSDGAPDKSKDAPVAEKKPTDPVEKPKPVPVALRAPAQLSKDAKAEWDKTPDSVKRDVIKREAENQRGVSQIQARNKLLEPFAQVTDQHSSMIQELGIHPVELFDSMLQWQRVLTSSDKGEARNAAIQFLERCGVDLNAALDQNGLPPDPEVAALKSQLSAMKRDMAKVTSNLSAQQQRAMDQQRASQAHVAYTERIASTVTSLSDQLPNMDKLSDGIVSHIPAIQQEQPNLSPDAVLSLAYMRAERDQKAKDATDAERNRTTDIDARKSAGFRAKAAANLNVKSAVPTSEDGLDEDEAMRAVYRRLSK